MAVLALVLPSAASAQVEPETEPTVAREVEPAATLPSEAEPEPAAEPESAPPNPAAPPTAPEASGTEPAPEPAPTAVREPVPPSSEVEAGAEAATVAEPESATVAEPQTTATTEPQAATGGTEVEPEAPIPPASETEEPAEPGDEIDLTVIRLGESATLEFGGRVHVMWRLSDESDEPSNEFALNAMRLDAAWHQGEWLDAVLEIGVEDAIQSGSATSLLQDAFVRLTAFPWLEIRAGQFKRPFSRLELLPRSRLATIDRGRANRWIIRRLGYGDRDIGLELGGRLWDDARLDYAIGVFNGAGAGLAESGVSGFKDLSARLEARPIRDLSFGVSFSLNTRESGDLVQLIDPAIFAEVDPAEFPTGYDEDDFRREHTWLEGTSWMIGADVGVHVRDLRLFVEALFGENWWFEGAPYTTSVTLLASYEIELSSDWGISLEPLVRGELVVPRIEFLDSRLWLAVVGVNLHLGEYVRVMIDGEFIQVQGEQPDEVARGGLWPGEWPGGWDDVNRLTVQLAFDI